VEGQPIEAAPPEDDEPVASATLDEETPVASDNEWPPAPPELAHLSGLDAENEETTDDEDEDDDGQTPEDGVPPPPTEETQEAGGQEPTETTPPDPKSERAERRRQRILDEYRASPEYQEELNKSREADRQAAELERQQAAEREQREAQERAAREHFNQSVGEYLGNVKAEGSEKPLFDHLTETIAAAEARKSELADAIAAADDPYDDEAEQASEELKQVNARLAQAKADKAVLERNRNMAGKLNDLAWESIATDYSAVLEFPELAALSDEEKAAIARPSSLRDGLARIRTALLAGASTTHEQQIAEIKAAHATEIKALNADREALRARAGGAAAGVETRGTAASSGGMTLDRYRRLTPEQQADVKPEDIDRMMAAEAARRQVAA
jgi:hypothetical protein